ncbi:SMP-30/gluconolactonase/LRE family protein [Paraburkholderia caribensis]|uniref:SMP-30/gluconolactonase/LRE family protein n=1 Tax=Paraburkholderia caribensis TaxID=75105 RepID=UPI000722B8B0|nr:SMP-30/gluconolactonase/LRE family protein [Paraburkholderia caribensis]ALP68751.1 gluconolaconase [Paraburkholderia caribensis]AUT58113.1 SMP-30/gluconolactonase/LRE family protein [Paraburkholderia caribensis]
MTIHSVPGDFHIPFDDLKVVARGLVRPECVLALDDGSLVTAHGQGGYSIISSVGEVSHHLAHCDTARKYVPNGIALAPNGKMLFADLGNQYGGIFSLDRHGHLETVLDSVDGTSLPPSNFVMVDEHDVLWFTVSTRNVPRSKSWNHHVRDGFIGVIDGDGARIVADGLGYTNEIAFSPDRRWVYVNETYAQRISRYPLTGSAAKPRLGKRETLVQLSEADLPDGLAFDVAGGLWVTCIASNKVLLVRPDRTVQVIVEDSDPAHVGRIAAGIRESSLEHADMQTPGNSRLGNVSSIAFGGRDMRTAYLGCLLDDCVRSFRSPIPGVALPHRSRRIR